MKKILVILLILIICFLGFVGCGKSKGKDNSDYMRETLSDTRNEDKIDSSNLENDELDEDDKGIPDETKQEDLKQTTGDKSEKDQNSWSKDVQI